MSTDEDRRDTIEDRLRAAGFSPERVVLHTEGVIEIVYTYDPRGVLKAKHTVAFLAAAKIKAFRGENRVYVGGGARRAAAPKPVISGADAQQRWEKAQEAKEETT